MHEYGMMESILADAQAEAERRGATVLAIRVELGELASVNPESLETAFMALTKGTPLDGVCLEISEIPGHVRCDACGLTGAARELGLEGGHDEPLLLCPRCGFFLTATQGRGVALREVTLSLRDANSLAVAHRSTDASPVPMRSRQ